MALTTLTLAARFMITYAYNTGLNLTLEIVPTAVRGQGLAFSLVMSQVFNFFVPYIVHTVYERPKTHTSSIVYHILHFSPPTPRACPTSSWAA